MVKFHRKNKHGRWRSTVCVYILAISILCRYTLNSEYDTFYSLTSTKTFKNSDPFFVPCRVTLPIPTNQSEIKYTDFFQHSLKLT